MRTGTKRKVPRVERLALEYVAWCDRWEPVLQRRPGYNDQLQRSADSNLANVGEAMDSATLPEKRRYFGYALASTGESLRLLRGARRNGLLPEEAIAEGLRTLRDLKWDLIRLIAWTRR